MPLKILINIDKFLIEKFKELDDDSSEFGRDCFQECLNDWATILSSLCKNPEESLTLIKKSIDANSAALSRASYAAMLTELHQSIAELSNLLATHLKHFSLREAYYTAWASFYDAFRQKKNTRQILINFKTAQSNYRAFYQDALAVELITTSQLIAGASKIVTNVQNDLSSSVNLGFEFSEDFIGTKSSKLIELDQLSKTLNTLGLPIKVQVPELSPLNHEVISNHLDAHFPTWQKDWNAFVEKQPKGSTTISPAANTILQGIRNNISKAFTSRAFSAFETLEPFLASLPKSALLMVRSTGKEDTVEIANPGGNESIPAVALEEKAITKAVGDVVVSYFSDKSLMQRLLSGDNITEPPFMPVLIQRMIGESFDLKSTKNKQIVKSGVMYAQKNGIRIQLAPGHGELVVNSKGTFDSYVVTNENVVYPEIYRKPNRLVPKLVSENGKMVTKLELHKNSKTLSDSPSLSLSTALAIAKVGRHIHKHFDMPMDIEFVYDESNNTLSLVQARPIPKGDVRVVIPSAIAPDKLPDIKKNSETHNAFVITPAGYATHVITDKNQVIVADTIEQALTQYLKPQANSPTKIVIVKEVAPATSHAAAQFNTKAIPVFAVDNLQSIQEWVSKSPLSIIADTQHKLLVKLANQATEKSLYDNETLKEGLFKSSLPSQLTLMPQIVVPNYKNALTNHTRNANTRSPLMIGDLIENIHSQNEKLSQESFYELTDALFNFLTTQWPAAQIPKNNIYTFLIKQIEFLESAKPQQKNSQEFIHALHVILTIFYRLAHKNKGNHALQMLLRQAMITAIEIKDQLKQFENVDDANINDAQEEYLNLISKLEALIINPGNSQLLSHSLRQIIQEKKAFQQASKVNKFETLSPTQKMYFVEFHKLAKLALNTKIATEWKQFAMLCCRSEDTTFQLAQLIKFNLKNHITADWINNLSLSQDQLSANHELKKMRDNSVKVSAELASIDIENTRTIMGIWEQNIPLWSDPKKFQTLWNEFHREFLRLFDKHNYSSILSNTSQKIILKTIQDLTEIFDRTIKAVKGSCEYNPNYQLTNFVILLEHYRRVMNKWVSYVPDSLFINWNKNIAEARNSNLKKTILSNIKKRFEELSQSSDVDQLNPSGDFCVASAKIGNTATFTRQFVEVSVTLEDMFTLFHQNILTSLTILSPTKLNYSQFPEIIQPFLNEFRTLKTRPVTNVYGGTYESEHPLEFLSATHEYPIISIDYNLPLRNHALKFIIEHNQQTQQTYLHAKFFGQNWNDRMTVLCRLAHIETQFLNVIEKHKVAFNQAARSIELTWELTKEQTQDTTFSTLLTEVMRELSEYTFTSFTTDKAGFSQLLSKYSPIEKVNGLKRFLTSSGPTRLSNESYIKEIILPIAIAHGLPLQNCYTTFDLSELFRNGGFDSCITKPYTLAKLNKFKETYKIDIPWSAETTYGMTLLEAVLQGGCSNEEFIQLIQSNNINLSDFSVIFSVILSKNNFTLFDFFEKNNIELRNQKLTLQKLATYYSKPQYKKHIEKAIQLSNGNIDLESYGSEASNDSITLLKFALPYATTSQKADLLYNSIINYNNAQLCDAIMENAGTETLSSFDSGKWWRIYEYHREKLLRLIDSPHFSMNKPTLQLLAPDYIGIVSDILEHKPKLINDASVDIINALAVEDKIISIKILFGHNHFKLENVENVNWSQRFENQTLLEHVVEKLSLNQFARIISQANFKFDSYPNLIHLVSEKMDFMQFILMRQLPLANQHISLEKLYKLYTQDSYANLYKEMLSNNIQIIDSNYLEDSQTFTTFLNRVAPHLLIGAATTLFTQAILKKYDVTISTLLANKSKDEIIKGISSEVWIQLFYSSQETLLKYVDYKLLLTEAGKNIDLSNNASFCVDVLIMCLKNNLALYPALTNRQIQKYLSSYTYREELLSNVTVKMCLSLVKLYSINLYLLSSRSQYGSTPFLYDLLKSEFEVQDFIELFQIAKLDTNKCDEIYNTILESKKIELLIALNKQNIVFHHQTIKLQYLYDHFTNKEMTPVLLSLIQDHTRTIDFAYFKTHNLSEEFIKLFYPSLKTEEKLALFYQALREESPACKAMLELDSLTLLSSSPPYPISLDPLIQQIDLPFLLDHVKTVFQKNKRNLGFFKKVFLKALDSDIDLTNYISNATLKEMAVDYVPSTLTIDKLKYLKKQYDFSIGALSVYEQSKLLTSIINHSPSYQRQTLDEILQLIHIQTLDMSQHPHLVEKALQDKNYPFLLAFKQLKDFSDQTISMDILTSSELQANNDIADIYTDILKSVTDLGNGNNASHIPDSFLQKYHSHLNGTLLAKNFAKFICGGQTLTAEKYLELESEKVLSHLSKEQWSHISINHLTTFGDLVQSPHFKLDKVGLLAMANASFTLLEEVIAILPNLAVIKDSAADILILAEETYSEREMRKLTQLALFKDVALPANNHSSAWTGFFSQTQAPAQVPQNYSYGGYYGKA